jgi:hypothetical protein
MRKAMMLLFIIASSSEICIKPFFEKGNRPRRFSFQAAQISLEIGLFPKYPFFCASM